MDALRFAVHECLCGGVEFRREVIHDLYMKRCVTCGVVHQAVPMTQAQLRMWYEHDYMGRVYTHTYEHDREVARKRLGSYQIAPGKRLLDVGYGNGAFVDECTSRGVVAVGCDVNRSRVDDEFYNDELQTVHFPSNNFDVVTVHDVLEHVPNLIEYAREIARVVKDDGLVFVDFPRFFEPSGLHHWKKTEHLWMLTEAQFVDVLSSVGLYVRSVDVPVSGKSTFTVGKRSVRRTSILVPPGIGDSFWCLTKMESFCSRNGLGMPDVSIASTRKDRDRAVDFVSRFPFLRCRGYFNHSIKNEPVWKKAYHDDGDGVLKNVLGFDYFLSANGPFRYDKTMDDIMPEYETDWYPPMFVSNEEKKYAAESQRKFGGYVVGFFTDHGMYQRWLSEFRPAQIVETLKLIKRRTNLTVVLTGASWDNNRINDYILRYTTRDEVVSLIGDTSLEEFLGLLRGSSGCIGYCGGNTIFATVLRKPTVILWNQYFNAKFFEASCPPDSLNKWYYPVDTKGATPSVVLDKFERALRW